MQQQQHSLSASKAAVRVCTISIHLDTTRAGETYADGLLQILFQGNRQVSVSSGIIRKDLYLLQSLQKGWQY